MSTIRLRGCAPDIIVPRLFIDKYMLSASGDHIKIYLLLLKAQQSGTDFDIAEAADLLDTTEKDITRSLNYWEKQGLLLLEKSGRTVTGIAFADYDEPVEKNTEEAAAKAVIEEAVKTAEEENEEAPEPVQTVPAIVITSEMIAEAEANPDFKTLATITQTYANKLILNNDYELLVRFFYRMEKNLDVCELIVAYLADIGSLNMKQVDKLSTECISRNYKDAEGVKYYLAQTKLSAEIASIIGLSTSKLPPARLTFLDKWALTYHFSDELIKEACNRAALNTDKVNFKYIDSILSSWYDKGYTTLEDVSKGDEEHRSAQQQKYGNKAKKTPVNRFNDIDKREIDFSADEAEFMTKHIKKK